MRATLLAAVCMVAFAHGAQAQPARRARAQSQKIRISINAADQVTSRTLSQNFSVPVNAEPASIATAIDVMSAPMFDVGGSYRFLNRLAAGVAYSVLSKTVGGTVDAKIPHPFFFNQPRSISGDLSDLQHRESTVHVFAMYMLPLSARLEIGVFGGPSFFSVKQDFANDIQYQASYPFDTASFSGAPTETISRSATGYNVGTDIAWRLSKTLAVGGLIRFTGASTTFDVTSGNTVDADIGGLQTGAGIRIIF